MINKATAILALLDTHGLGYAAVNEALVLAGRHDLDLAGLIELPPQDVIEALPTGEGDVALSLSRCEPRQLETAAAVLEEVAAADVSVVLVDEAHYPVSLRTALGKMAPPVLFVLGEPELLTETFAAVVGSRTASPEGLEVAAACAAAYSAEGIPIVSGGAEGVDMAAHRAAVEGGGRTLMVLPQGILSLRGRGTLWEDVSDGRAAVVSEFFPHAGWVAHQAVRRNATISGFARVVCVVEPRKTGGSIRTARLALDQGKRVLIYEGEDGVSQVRALLRAGAVPLAAGDTGSGGGPLMVQWREASAESPKQAELF